MNKFRRLRASEIDARVNTVSKKGCSLLLYKDARVDQNILDETLGYDNWQRSHQMIGDRLYCTVSIWSDEKEQWISKQDVGTESNTEKEKGQASDSFKRACFNLGIGRELYTAPFIWIPASEVNITVNDKGKDTTYDKFAVTDIGYDDEGNINKLTIKNLNRKKVVYQMGVSQEEPKKEDEPTEVNDIISAVHLKALKKRCADAGVPEDVIKELYKVPSLENLNYTQYRNINDFWHKIVERSGKHE